MSHFDDFIQKLSAEHKIKFERHEAERTREAEEHEAFLQSLADQLEEEVLPLFLEAERACTAQGLIPVITRNWDEELCDFPAVEFELFGPKQHPYNAGDREIRAHSVVAAISDGKVLATVTRGAQTSTTGLGYVGVGSEGVIQALKHSIASYYDEISSEIG